MTGKRTPRASVAAEGQRYAVNVYNARNKLDVVTVKASSGDEAAALAIAEAPAGSVVRGVALESEA